MHHWHSGPESIVVFAKVLAMLLDRPVVASARPPGPIHLVHAFVSACYRDDIPRIQRITFRQVRL